MISAILAILTILFTASFLSILFKKNIALTIPTAFFASILTMYFFSLFKFLELGYYFVLAFGLFSFIYMGIKIFYKKQFELKQYIISPSLIIFVILMCIIIYTNRNMQVFDWDWFAYWGKFVKTLIYDNQLHIWGDFRPPHLSYPPFFMLLEYFFLKGSSNISDQVALFAANLVSVVVIMPFFANASKNNILSTIFKLLIALIVVAYTPYTPIYHTLYTDVMLSAMFGFGMYIYFAQGLNKLNIITISLIVAALTLTKQIGFVFAVAIVGVIFIDMIVFNRKNISQIDNKRIIYLIFCALPFVSLIIAKFSWSTIIKIADATSWTDNKYSLEGFVSLFSGKGLEDYQVTTILNFKNALFNTPLMGALPFVFVVALYVLITVLIITFIIKREEKARYIVAFGIIFLGMCGYSILLLMNFVFGFSEGEAVALASYARYFPSYLQGMFILAFLLPVTLTEQQEFEGYYATQKKQKKVKTKARNSNKLGYSIWQDNKSLITITAVMVLTFFCYNIFLMGQYIFNPKGVEQYSESIRGPLVGINNIRDKVDIKNDKLDFISIAGNGYHTAIASYELFPMEFVGAESLGTEIYYEGDVWTQIISPNDWATFIKENANFVYLHKVYAPFPEVYGAIFEGGANNISENTLYKVNKDSQGLSCLVPIQ